MKKVLIVILVILLLALAGMGGFLWYRNTHIFVEDAVYAKNAEFLDLRGTGISIAHYETVRTQLPECRIVWDVPFQGGYMSSDVAGITIRELSDEDILRMDYFTQLDTVDATGCSDYGQIEALINYRPDLTVNYQVDLGGVKADPNGTELTLNAGEFSMETLTENLPHLKNVTSIFFPKAQLTLEELDALAESYPQITVDYTVDILGQEYPSDTASLDLSAMTSDQVDAAVANMHMLRSLETVELMQSGGGTNLNLSDVKKLQEAVPEAKFHFVFELYGVTISTDDEEVILKNVKPADYSTVEEDLRSALSVMTNCKRFVLDNHGMYDKLWRNISNETLAQIREDFRDKTKFVWRVFFGKDGSSLTDAQVVRAVYGLVDDNSSALQYLEDAIFMDIGHNEFLDEAEFVRGMKSLEVVIISGSPIKSLEPFAECKALKFLELSNCTYITDLTPLAQCTALEMLNISFTGITDLAPIEELPLTHLTAVKNKIPDAEENRYAEAHPDCWIVTAGDQPYGVGWRYDKDEQTKLPWYEKLANAFKYPDPYNNVGWYLD